ncbi:hypothetical protein OEA41_010752 [Lepraria neglecta]|uniref:Uncharacterized protein n=1 Tax=Lepraria neglecta TaxID=209136 RepID=A0AAD9YXW5_9LECA|nr:hypothetical protein OEA41_010752 [Lepraria neglecta]
MSEKHTDTGSAYGAPGSSSDIDCARGIDKGGPGRQGTGNAVSFTSGLDFGSFSNDPTPPFHHGAPPDLGGTSPTTSAAPPFGQRQDPNGTSYPVGFPLGYVETGDQGKAFFQDPISTYEFGDRYGGQNTICNAPPIDQSQVFLEDPFGLGYAGDGNGASLSRYGSIITDKGLAFSQNPYMTSRHSHDMAFAGRGLDFPQILPSAGS